MKAKVVLYNNETKVVNTYSDAEGLHAKVSFRRSKCPLLLSDGSSDSFLIKRWISYERQVVKEV